MSDERFSSVPVGDRTRDCPWTPVLQQPKVVPVPVRQLNMRMDRHSVLRRYGMTVFRESNWAFESCFLLPASSCFPEEMSPHVLICQEEPETIPTYGTVQIKYDDKLFF